MLTAWKSGAMDGGVGFVGAATSLVRAQGATWCSAVCMARGHRGKNAPAVAKQSVRRSPVGGDVGSARNNDVQERKKGVEYGQMASEAKPAENEAVNKVVMDNMWLVFYIAKRSQWKNSPHYDDIIQEGFVGLMYAARKFVEGKGKVSFSTYASYWIRQAMSRAQWRSALVHVPHRKYQILSQLRRTRSQLEARLGRGPTVSELARELGWKADIVKKALHLSGEVKDVISLDSTVADGMTGFDVIESADMKAVSPEDIKDAVADLEMIIDETLDSDERDIIRNKFGLGDTKPMSRKELAEGLKVSEATISNRKARAINKLKQRQADLRPYLTVL